MTKRKLVLIISLAMVALLITSGVVFAGVKGFHATIGRGQDNTAAGDFGTVGGGRGNAASGEDSTIGGVKY